MEIQRQLLQQVSGLLSINQVHGHVEAGPHLDKYLERARKTEPASPAPAVTVGATG